MNRNCAKHDISVLFHSTFDLKQLQRAKNIWHFVSLFLRRMLRVDMALRGSLCNVVILWRESADPHA